MLLRSRSHSTPKESVLYKSTEDTRACVVKGNRERIFQRGMFTTEKDCEAKIDWVHSVPQTEKKNSVVRIYPVPEVFACGCQCSSCKYRITGTS